MAAHHRTRAAIYARVSTNGQSTESQLSDLLTYAQARNLEATEYVDHGHTGASERRPALDRLMNDARKRRFDCVLVWRFDRFAGSTKHLLLALEEFRSSGRQQFSKNQFLRNIRLLCNPLFSWGIWHRRGFNGSGTAVVGVGVRRGWRSESQRSPS